MQMTSNDIDGSEAIVRVLLTLTLACQHIKNPRKSDGATNRCNSHARNRHRKIATRVTVRAH